MKLPITLTSEKKHSQKLTLQRVWNSNCRVAVLYYLLDQGSFCQRYNIMDMEKPNCQMPSLCVGIDPVWNVTNVVRVTIVQSPNRPQTAPELWYLGFENKREIKAVITVMQFKSVLTEVVFCFLFPLLLKGLSGLLFTDCLRGHLGECVGS